MRHLDGDEPLQLVIVGEVDEAEAAFAQDPFDPIATDVCGQDGIGINSGQIRAVQGLESACIFEVASWLMSSITIDGLLLKEPL